MIQKCFLWKKTEVFLIFKIRSKSNPLKCKPVSLTSVYCKDLDKIIATHDVDFLETNYFMSPNQFSFSRHRSTEDQLLLICLEIINEVNKRKLVDMVYIDFSKAFDIENYEILLMKLSCLGFSDQVLGWIKYFLYWCWCRKRIEEYKNWSPTNKFTRFTVAQHLF